MRTLLVVLFLAFFSDAILPRGQDGPLQSSEEVHLKFATLFEKCNAGYPILLESGDLPGNHRAIGDPCATDIQCSTGLCRCVSTGGKECVARPRACAPVDALFALDAECWDPSSPTWNTLGYEPSYSGIDIAGLTPSHDGTVRPGAAAGSFQFNGVVKTVRGLDIGPAAHPSVTLELWVKRLTRKNDKEWIIGHDNGGFDRAIALNDNRYGGVAAPSGQTYSSSLGYLDLNRWYHVVVTYGALNAAYLNGVGQAHPVGNNEGLPDMTIGGLSNFANHDVNALISQVRVYDRALSGAEVQAHFDASRARYGR